MNESISHSDGFMWFQKNQLEAVIRNGVVPSWFHGIISRKTSEELLMCKPPGCFLIRVSESRIGYTLSYRAEDRCRHFMIDATKDGYVILGDNRPHRLLEDLVDFHLKFPIKPINELLTVPCGRMSDVNTDYEELLFQKSISVPDVPPVPPCRPSSTMDSAAQPSCLQPSTLYPSLDHLHNALPCVDLTQAVPSSKTPYTANTPMPSQPSDLPSRNVKLVPKKNQPGTRTNCALPSLPKDHRDPVDSLTSVVTNLKKFKKKLNRKSTSTEQSVSEEVTVKGEVKPEANEYHEIADHQIVQADLKSLNCVPIRAELPQEYLQPPPFAPGYT